jgi:phage gp36-like protein
VHRVVAEWSRAIARYYLHKDAISDANTSPIARDYRDAMKLLQQLAEGKFSLGVDDPLSPTYERDVRSFGAERKFTDDTLRDY